MKIQLTRAGRATAMLCSAALFGCFPREGAAQSAPPAELMAKVKESARAYRLLTPKLQARTTRHIEISAPLFKQTVVTTVKHNAHSALRWDQTKDGNGVILSENVYCRNKRYAFIVRKRNAGNWFLGDLVFGAPHKIKWSGSSKSIDQAVTEVIAPQFTAFVPGTPLLPEVFASKGFRRANTPQARKAGRDLPALGFEYAGTYRERTHSTKGTMMFAADRNWGLRRVESRYEGPEGVAEQVVEFEYEGKLDRFAKPSKISRKSKMTRKGGEVSLTTAITAFELKLDDRVLDTEFTLSAFGLPEPNGIASVRFLDYGVRPFNSCPCEPSGRRKDRSPIAFTTADPEGE